jgi:hypothetical protein
MAKGRVRAWAWLIMALLGAALVGLWLMPSTEEVPATHSANALQPAPAFTPPSTSSSAEHGSIPSPPPSTAGEPRPVVRQLHGGRPITPEAERLRERVLDSLRRRQQDPATQSAGSKAAAAGHAPGTMVDRTGELGEDTMRVINHELMPLVSECFDQASERNPKLRGTLAFNVELAGAEELGGIIETVEPAPDRNQLQDDELIECVRQSAFSIQLPAPTKSGRTSRQLTIPFGEPLPGDAGR